MILSRIARFFSRHLSLLVLIPCLFLALVLTFDIYRAVSKMNDAYDAEYNAFFSHGVLTLVHETQKERGLTAAFIGAQGGDFIDELKKQRAATDTALSHFKQEAQHWVLSDNMEVIYKNFLNGFNRLSDTRQKISNLDITLKDALSFYTSINNQGLHAVIIASKLSHDQIISSELFAIYNFSSAKENAGIERAVLSNVIAKDKFSPELKAKHISLVTKQNVFLNEAFEAAPDEMLAVFKRLDNSTVNQSVQAYRDKVNTRNADFNLSAKDWFTAATQRINLLKELEEEALTLVDKTAIKIQKNSLYLLVYEIVVLAAGIIVTFLLVYTLRLRKAQSEEIRESIEYVIEHKDLAHKIKKISHDELGKTADDINTVLQSINNDFLTFKASLNEISGATYETASASEQSHSNLMQQETQVETIASAAEQMGTNVSVIAESMKENASLVNSVVEHSQQGKFTVSEAVNYIGIAADDMTKSSESIEHLNNRVENISSMVDMIRSIAEQTNLLALNAAIEAARAGDQGRGFAVVADEVRNLAQRTQNSTEEISNLVVELQNSSQYAQQIMQQGRDNAMEASTRAADIESTLDSIVGRVESVKDVTDTVSKNTHDQSQAITEVNVNIRNIFDQAHESVEGSHQIMNSAKQIETLVKEMNDKINSYKLSNG